MTRYTLELTREQVDLVLGALGNCAFTAVHGLVSDISAQMRKQLEAEQKPEEPPPED